MFLSGGAVVVVLIMVIFISVGAVALFQMGMNKVTEEVTKTKLKREVIKELERLENEPPKKEYQVRINRSAPSKKEGEK